MKNIIKRFNQHSIMVMRTADASTAAPESNGKEATNGNGEQQQQAATAAVSADAAQGQAQLGKENSLETLHNNPEKVSSIWYLI